FTDNNYKTSYTPKGELVVEFQTGDIDTIYYWLLSFGPQVEIIEPFTLRSRIRKDLISMVTMY
ncbi:MAG: WYL domain-containing protein, partial [Candidatus Margulisbacteria bacterium]|nr:WYL domain-containing protein [Candidatus Margulisiibacteriota bacterium]